MKKLRNKQHEEEIKTQNYESRIPKTHFGILILFLNIKTFVIAFSNLSNIVIIVLNTSKHLEKSSRLF